MESLVYLPGVPAVRADPDLDGVGHLAASQNAVQDGVRIGQWLANQRRHGVMDDHPERERALRELDPWWRPNGGTIAWQRAANEVRLFLGRGGALDELVPGHIAGGRDIGTWAQRHRGAGTGAGLRPGQLRQLDELGIRPEGGGGAAAEAAGVDVGGPGLDRDGARVPRCGRGVWETAFAAAVAHHEREGHLEVPRARRNRDDGDRNRT
ncbi:helicase associated domain-containing protein [Embleya sp. NPDC056575]|uniref:helicase associated domain-containing protein n=1 Tax=unclassified Embleya TaxID=2699296 RepID=UPI0036919779